MTNDQINAIAQTVAVAVAHALSNMNTASLPSTAPKSPVTKPKASPKLTVVQPKADKLTKRHATIVAKFQARGIKDPKLFTDIKPYQAWLAVGRQVKRDAKSVQGLFHITQTDLVKA